MYELTFEKFPKIGRLSKGFVVTEKLDGTNAQIVIAPDGEILVGSRTRVITPDNDNYGFAAWVYENQEELVDFLGVGRHYGEWWGYGIQRGYGLPEKKFSLFNTGRWSGSEFPEGVDCVPVLGYVNLKDMSEVDTIMKDLYMLGSRAAPGYMKPEGIVMFHTQTNTMFKRTFEHDEKGKNMPRDEHENVVEV